MEKEIIINNKLNETGRISQFMEELGVSLNIPSEIAMSMNLAIEEIIANIIQYAYPKGESSEIQLQAHITPGRLTFQITDEGIAVDPFQKKSPDEKPSLEEQLTKGLGHFLIHRTMDEVNYRTTDTQNLLTLVKRLDIDFKPDALLDKHLQSRRHHCTGYKRPVGYSQRPRLQHSHTAFASRRQAQYHRQLRTNVLHQQFRPAMLSYPAKERTEKSGKFDYRGYEAGNKKHL